MQIISVAQLIIGNIKFLLKCIVSHHRTSEQQCTAQ